VVRTNLLSILVSWSWNRAHPSGTAAEAKPGEVFVTSHQGNEISKIGGASSPDVHIDRSGNDVVRTANELDVESKGQGTDSSGSKDEEKREEEKNDKEDGEKNEEKAEGERPQAGERRKADKQAVADGEKDTGEKEDGEEAKKQKTSNGSASSAGNGKKGPGRPKGSAKGEKKVPKKPKREAAVGRAERKTRSQGSV